MSKTFSVKFWKDDTKKVSMSTQTHGKTKEEAKEKFLASHRGAVIIEFREL